MSEKPQPNLEKQIDDAVRTTLESGDFSHLKGLGGTVQRAVQDSFASAPGTATPKKKEKTKTELWIQKNAAKPAKKKSIFANKNYGIGSVFCGVLGLVAFGSALALLGITGLLVSMPAIAFLPMVLILSLCTIASTCLFANGLGRRALIKRLRQYGAFLLEKPVWSIDALCAATHFSTARIRRDIRLSYKKNLLYHVQMDTEESCVIYGEENYRLYLNSERTRQEHEANEAKRQQLLEDPQTAPMEHFRSEGQAALQSIHSAIKNSNDDSFVFKLKALETTIERIFNYVQSHPQKLPDTRKFIDYYLPSTLKLLNKYRQYEEEDLHLEPVLLAKADIVDSLDTLNVAFGNLLESLYHEDTLDVVTDIDVLHTMLEQEGLTEPKFNLDIGTKNNNP